MEEGKLGSSCQFFSFLDTEQLNFLNLFCLVITAETQQQQCAHLQKKPDQFVFVTGADIHVEMAEEWCSAGCAGPMGLQEEKESLLQLAWILERSACACAGLMLCF